MYDNGYEQYMRSVLGYQNDFQNYNTYENYYEGTNGYFPYRSGNNNYVACNESENRFEERYPDIYKIIKPMVKKACGNNSIDRMSNNEIDLMVDDIYRNIHADDVIVNVNVTTESNR